MKRKLLAALFAALFAGAALMGCSSPAETVSVPSGKPDTVQEDSSETVTSEMVEAVSSDVSSAASSQISSADTSSETPSETDSSRTVSSAPVPSTAVSQSVSSKPVETKPQSAVTASSKEASSTPASSKTAEPPPPASSKTEIPKDKLPMTDAEVDALIQEGIEYAESFNMVWYEDFSVAGGSGYDPPAYSDLGYKSCKGTFFFNIEELYKKINEDAYHTVGDPIAFKIEKGKIKDDPGWYIYVLY